jgi:hypothetical protein
MAPAILQRCRRDRWDRHASERHVREILDRGFEVVDKTVEGAEACGLQDLDLLRLPG